MAVNEALTARVRETLAGAPRVAEKRMFRGITFMVDGKMCVSVGDDRIMCRIDPDRHAEALRKPGCRTVEMGGRPYIGFVYVDERSLGSEKELRAWVDLALEYNSRAKSSKASEAGRPRKAGAPSGAASAPGSRGSAKRARAPGAGSRAKAGKPAKRGGRAADKPRRPAEGAAAKGARTATGSKAARGAKAAKGTEAARGAKAAEGARASKAPKQRR